MGRLETNAVFSRIVLQTIGEKESVAFRSVRDARIPEGISKFLFAKLIEAYSRERGGGTTAGPLVEALLRTMALEHRYQRNEYLTVLSAAVGFLATYLIHPRESLLRWLELHYFTLADTLRYLQDRQAARVRITAGLAAKGWDTREVKLREADLEVTAFDSFRVLRKESVAFVPIPVTGRRTEAEAAFLIEREQWNAFTALVKEEQRRLPDLRFEQTGPWPPYDFVHLELSG